MAEEIIKKALSLDLGESINSVRELKNYINILRDSLVGLDKDSDEWKATSIQLADAQAHLADIMNAGKKSADAAEGSYNALAKQMSDLKKVWKATADEAERDAIGKQINSLNDQLKDLDASIGNHQRNVGNYASALDGLFADLGEVTEVAKDATDGFEGLNAILGLSAEQSEAFGDILNKLKAALKISQAISKVAKGTKEYASAQGAATTATKLKTAATVSDTTATAADTTATQAHTVAQNASTVATKASTVAMKALRVAIASTGIGLLVTALAYLVTNFNKVKEAIQPVIDRIVAFVGPIEELKDKVLNVLKSVVSGVVGVGNVIGQALLVPIKNALDGFKGLGDAMDDLFHLRFKDAAKTALATGKEIMENFKKGFSFKQNFEDGKKVGEQFYDMMSSGVVKVWAWLAGNKVGDGVKEGIIEAISELDMAKLLVGLSERDKQKVIDGMKSQYKDMQKTLTEWQEEQNPFFKAMNEEFRLTVQYDEMKEVYKELGKDTTELDQWYADQKTKIWDKANEHLVEEAVKTSKKIIDSNEETGESTKHLTQEQIYGFNAVGDALGNLGGLFEESTAAYKATAIAQALISTYLAADQVMATEFGEAWIKIAAMSAVLTAGLANVASILSVNPKGEKSAKGSSPAPSTAIPVIGESTPINYTRNITSASEEERLNQPIQAYVVESEITASQELAMRRSSNSTF